jgi:hypothetical protein
MEKNPISPEGAAKLRDELHNLRSVERPRVIQMIATAREHGDLKENAEYHAARERQSFIEGRVKEIENKLARAEIIDPSKLAGRQGSGRRGECADAWRRPRLRDPRGELQIAWSASLRVRPRASTGRTRSRR